MAQKKPPKNANVLTAKPGVEALTVTTPVLIDSAGKWDTMKPANLDEKNLRAVVQYLVSSNAISTAQSYCSQCTSENKKKGGKTDYVPVIVMPIFPSPASISADTKYKELRRTQSNRSNSSTTDDESSEQREKNRRSKLKQKKRGFVLQRFTDFDLLSQW